MTRETLQAIRDQFKVDYRDDGEISGVAYGSKALPEVVRLLDKALAASQPAPAMDYSDEDLSPEAHAKLREKAVPSVQRFRDAQARQRGENLDGSSRRETVTAADTGQAVDSKMIAQKIARRLSAEITSGEPKGWTYKLVYNTALLAAKMGVECGLIAHPAPLDAERVREDERDQLYAEATELDFSNSVRNFLLKRGARLPADRAALRQKD